MLMVDRHSQGDTFLLVVCCKLTACSCKTSKGKDFLYMVARADVDAASEQRAEAANIQQEDEDPDMHNEDASVQQPLLKQAWSSHNLW